MSTTANGLPYPLPTDSRGQGAEAIRDLAEAIDEAIWWPGAQPGPWFSLPFAAGWGNYGQGYQHCEYRKVGDVVQLRGLCAGSGGHLVCVLPVGFRPPVRLIFATDSSNAHTRLDVVSDGSILLGGGGGPTSSGHLTLSGIWFSTV